MHVTSVVFGLALAAGAPCGPGGAEWCERSASQLLEKEGASEADAERARVLLAAACDLRLVTACERLARLFEEGLELPLDLQGAAELRAKACRLGDSGSCLVEAERRLGRPVRCASAAGVELVSRDCAAGDALSCVCLGDLSSVKALFPSAALPASAEPIYQRACELGAASGCSALGHGLLDTDPPRGRALLEQGCRGGDGLGCLLWATHVPAETRQELLELACRANELRGCARLGALLLRRPGADASTALERSCRGFDPEGCETLGAWLLNRSPAEQARGHRLVEYACRSGLARACALAAFDFEHGRGVGRDSARACRFSRVACSRGDAAGCESVAACPGGQQKPAASTPPRGPQRPTKPRDPARAKP